MSILADSTRPVAVFLANYLAIDGFSRSKPLQYAFVGALSLAFVFLVSPITSYSIQRYGIRPTMMAGVVLQAADLIPGSFVENWLSGRPVKDHTSGEAE